MTTQPNDLNPLWMPFTPQRGYKKKPRSLVSAKGMYYTSDDGRQLLDANAGLWCTNLGHNHPKVVEAIQKQAAKLDFAPNFQLSHPVAFEAASRLCAEMPGDIDNVFFSNSGSEAVDTALKIALAYHRQKGESARTKFIGRRRSYNGVGFGGISVGGIPYCRKVFNSALLPQVDHMPETYSLEHQAFSKGEPDWGMHLADELENIIYMNDAENIAGVIVEPVAGSTGVLVPPKGYLKRLREICDKHNLILIFDEVITAWGRLGKASAAEYFDVLPDMITSAKGINNGAVPLGATFVRKGIYDAFMSGPEDGIEFMHGYTYSGHPLACAAAIATLDAAKEEGLYERATEMAPIWEDALHSLKDAPHVIDIRNIGLMGAVELDPGMRGDDERSRAMEAFDRMFFEEDLVMRFTGNVIASSPPLIVTEDEISQIVDGFRRVLNNIK
ncbi:MAG: aspartate aminotransferase family protein [Gammaproteobacteria bacterium]|nr:aspartate aminotransferase family protein [Gammaproteobacteria bacterium]